MVSPLFQVFSIDRELSTPFNLAQTLAAARAVLFSPNSTTVYKLPSSLMIIPRLISAVFAIYPVKFYPPVSTKAGGKSTAKTTPGQDLLKWTLLIVNPLSGGFCITWTRDYLVAGFAGAGGLKWIVSARIVVVSLFSMVR